MPKKKNVLIDYTSRDFSTIKDDLIDHAQRYYPKAYKDFTVASFGGMVIDTVAYVGDLLSYYLDYSVNESFLDTAIEFDNVRKHANALGYNYSGTPSTFGLISLFVIVPSNTDGNAPDTRYLPILKRGSTFASNGGQFVLTEDVDFNNAKTEFVAARFNTTSGATTSFAVKAVGQIQSGRLQSVEIDLKNTAFERFRKIRVGSNTISDIVSVTDLNGNIYHQVDNLAQEVVFLETTNDRAKQDGVRSILKPFVASRRFVVNRNDTGTYIQFGFGSDEEDSTGIVEPSKIALKMHGKNTISNNSFDPTKLLSTNKLGISPYNTVLKIIYRVNNPGSSTAAANTITRVVSPTMRFADRTVLNPASARSVTDSLECSNEVPLFSSNVNITTEELKERAKAHYAAQGRAVTKQDYESLCYNMPAKFGAIKRANIINDSSATNRRMSLYVISENENRNLAMANVIVKNNLKNWLSHYKILNDVIDIYDAKIVNFNIDFSVITDRAYDSESVLRQCIKHLTEYFSTPFYIGEPLYLTRLYDTLNDVDGVVSVRTVKASNKTGGRYSGMSMNFDQALSRDGTYIETPKNAILELKFPEDDIKGTAK